MWNTYSEWLPVISFLFGTGLGWVLNAIFEGVRRKHLEKLYQNTNNTNVALESQLVAKSRLEQDLGRTNTELEQLRNEVKKLASNQGGNHSLLLQNLELKRQLELEQNRQIAEKSEPKVDYVNEYQVFLTDLEKSIKKAKKKAYADEDFDDQSEIESDSYLEFKKPKKKKSKNKRKSKTESKYDFYKQKYSGENLAGALFEGNTKKKDLSYLYGINNKIQDLLNANGIKSFNDLSNTKIAELRTILARAGGKFEDVDPLNWPIQARIAEKGQWEILDEYKSKMEM